MTLNDLIATSLLKMGHGAMCIKKNAPLLLFDNPHVSHP